MSKNDEVTVAAAVGQNSPPIEVGIYARIVAAGSTKDADGKDDKARVTLLLTPAPGPGTTTLAGGSRLHTWPTDVLRELDKLKTEEGHYEIPVVFECVTWSNGMRARPTLAPSALVTRIARATNLRRAFGDDEAARSTVDKLWRETFSRTNEEEYGDPWAALKVGLEQSFDGSSLKPSKIAGDDASKGAISDVRSIRQSDIALSLELLRAHEVAATVREALGETAARVNLERSFKQSDPELAGPNPALSQAGAPLPNRDEIKEDLEAAKWEERQRAYGLLNRNLATPAKAAYEGAAGLVAGNAMATLPPTIAFGDSTNPALAAQDDPATVHGKSEAPLASHVDGTWLEQEDTDKSPGAASTLRDRPAPGDPSAEATKHASQRFFALQSAPSLARLFCLAIDLELDPHDVPEGYVFIGTPFGRSATTLADAKGDRTYPPAMTLARFQVGKNEQFAFWPATRAEIDFEAYRETLPKDDAEKLEESEFLTQRNGMLVLGQGWPERPRFDITSLDVRTAAETQEQRNRERRQLPVEVEEGESEGRSPGVRSNEESMRARPIERQTLLSAGMTLLDRGREHITAAKLATRSAQLVEKNKGLVLLDAEELTVGYRPDVGVFDGERYQWRGLMHREVIFGASGDKADMAVVSGLLVHLTGAVASEERTMLDSAVVSTPMRLMPEVSSTAHQAANGASGEPRPQHDPGIATIVEEIVTSWDGGPLGIDCSGADSMKRIVDDLPIGRDIKLPDDKKDRLVKPPRLRFGWPYRMGMRAVFMGGASPSVSDAEEAHALGDGGLAYPPGLGNGSPAEQRRFLRHERIDAPTLLLPSNLASEGHPLMGFERSPEAIVRTYRAPEPRMGSVDTELEDAAEAEAKRRAHPAETRRIVVVPGVAQAFAALHGAFDEDIGKGQPKQGLEGVRYDAPNGGFPFAVPMEARGLDGIVFPLRREVRVTEGAHGDAVFETGRGERHRPYYPDPAAHYLVLALRHPVTHEFIGGRPAVIPLYEDLDQPGGRPAYPRALPVEVVVRAHDGKRPRGAPVGHAEIIRYEGGTTRLRPNGGKGVEGRSLVLELCAGEDFELVAWCVPSVGTLARCFAVIETLGMLATVPHERPDPHNSGKYADRPAATLRSEHLSRLLAARPFAGLERTFPEPILRHVRDFLSGQQSRDVGFVGIGGLRTPGPQGLLAVAAVIHHVMRDRPVDEIAATVTLRVTHATSRPLLAPTLTKNDNPPIRQLTVARLSKESGDTLRATPAGERYEAFFVDRSRDPKAPPKIKGRVDPSASDFVLGGSVLIDLDTSDGFEIEAVTTYPRSAKIDDVNKRRTRDDRQGGVWPTVMDLTDGKRKLASTSDIYGFHVDRDGRVELPRSAVTLLRVERIADPSSSQQVTHAGELEIVNLETIYGLEHTGDGTYPTASGNANPQGGEGTDENKQPQPPDFLKNAKVALTHAFPDGKARRLSLSVRSLNRFGHSWHTAARRDENRIFQYGEPLPTSAESTRSEPVDVWLPATFRPGKPITRSPLPAFRWKPEEPCAKAGAEHTTIYEIERQTVTRVWLRREWFSSGEEEKVGVVLWPPNLFDDEAHIIADDWIIFSEDGSKPARHTRLSDFDDLDLGPGGAFITRWGGDPIRGGARQTSMFMPPTAFADYRKGDPASPELVLGVIMPIGASDPANGRVESSAHDDTGSITDTLTVSLLCYEPRFDVGSEEWYVDINIQPATATDPFVRLGLVRFQAHAPKDLQVSQPVVEWTQVLPSRRMRIEATDLADRTLVEASVTGLATEYVAEEGQTSHVSKSRYQRPVMIFSLMFEGQDRDGHLTQHLVDRISTEPAETEEESSKPKDTSAWIREASVKSQNGNTRWAVRFRPVGEGERLALGEGSFFVTAEEIEYRHPASYPGREPLTLGEVATDDTFVPSGPRFYARIDLTAAPLAGKEREAANA